MPRGQYDRSKMAVTSGKPRGRPPGSKNKTESRAVPSMYPLHQHLIILVDVAAKLGDSSLSDALAQEITDTLKVLVSARKAAFPDAQAIAAPLIVRKPEAIPTVPAESVQ